MQQAELVYITTEFIQLDQFLKWIGIADTGGQVKFWIEDRQLFVNNMLITERRKKLYPGDIIKLNDKSWIVATKS